MRTRFFHFGKRIFLSLPVLFLGTGFISGFTSITILAGTLAALLVKGLALLYALSGRKIFVTLDPRNPAPEAIAESFIFALSQVQNSGHPLSLLIAIPKMGEIPVPFLLSPGKKGILTLNGARGGSIPIPSSPYWIPDHPLPLPLRSDCEEILHFKPTRTQRVRVSRGGFPLLRPLLLLPLFFLLILLAVWGKSILSAFLTGAMIQTAFETFEGKNFPYR